MYSKKDLLIENYFELRITHLPGKWNILQKFCKLRPYEFYRVIIPKLSLFNSPMNFVYNNFISKKTSVRLHTPLIRRPHFEQFGAR